MRTIRVAKPRTTLGFAFLGRVRSGWAALLSIYAQFFHSSGRCALNPCDRCLDQALGESDICVLEVNRSHSEVAYDIATTCSGVGLRVCLVLNALALRERGLPSFRDFSQDVRVVFLPRRRFSRVVYQLNKHNTNTIASSAVDYWRWSAPLGIGMLKSINQSVRVVSARHSKSEQPIFPERGAQNELLMADWYGEGAVQQHVYRPTFPNRGATCPAVPRSVVVVGAVGKDFESLVAASLSAPTVVHIVGPIGRSHRRLLKKYGNPQQVVLHGPLTDDRLYALIQKCSYILGPIEVSNYLGERVSGARQLSLGFVRPLVINPVLASEWGLPTNSYLPTDTLAFGLDEVANEHCEIYRSRMDALLAQRERWRRQNVDALRSLFDNFS